MKYFYSRIALGNVLGSLLLMLGALLLGRGLPITPEVVILARSQDRMLHFAVDLMRSLPVRLAAADTEGTLPFSQPADPTLVALFARLGQEPPDSYAWSPDGRKLAYAQDFCCSVYDLDSDTIRQLSNASYLSHWLAWTADSQQIVYAHIREDIYFITEITTVNIVTGATQRLSESGGLLAWSPGVTDLLLSGPCVAGGCTTLLLIQRESAARRLINVGCTGLLHLESFAWSDTSGLVAFVGQCQGQTQLSILDTVSGEVQSIWLRWLTNPITVHTGWRSAAPG